ncbi:MAG: DNA-binding protein [Bacteroidales bacterium]|nr:DNA-binding protein [Bacteroidales bacterium]
MMHITFNELRRIKDQLPQGSMKLIADQLNLSEDTVRNYFGGTHYPSGESVGFHVEQGPDGGIVALDNSEILDIARKILNETAK